MQGSGTYLEGSIVTIKAVPDTGYRFVSWSDGATDSERTIRMHFSLMYTAYFEKDVVHVSGLYLDREELPMAIGESCKLTARVIPSDSADQSVVWTTGDGSVAAVDQYGNIKAVSKGQTTITATSNDGGFTDSCIITVSENDPSPAADYSMILMTAIIAVLIIATAILVYMKKRSSSTS